MTEKIIIISLLVSCLVLCFRKWGWLDVYEAKRKQWMPSGGCYLCLSFWLAEAMILFLLINHFNPYLFLIPFCTAPLSNLIIINSIIHDRN